MLRDLSRLAADRFDVLVIGAGVYGATIAWDAAQRGLTVALIDRADIGGGTSFNNAKTVHGGIRSLQHGKVRELREYMRERRALSRVAPHLVHPLPFLIPTYGRLQRGRLALRTYFIAYDLLTRDRNAGLDIAKQLGRSHILSRDECLRQHPAIDPDGVTGGALWYDCQMYSGDRVTLAFVKSAAAAGACVANYVGAHGLLREGDRVIGVQARDELTQGTFDVRAAVVVNAAGPWAADLLPTQGRGPSLVPALSRAMNIVTRPIAAPCALGGAARGRLFFVAPWRHVTIAGTSHDPFDGRADDLRVTEGQVQALLDDLNIAFPGLRLDLDDVRLVHRGLLPSLPPGRNGTVRLLKDSQIRDHRADGLPGLISVVGVRYTTARLTAERATDLIVSTLQRRAPACRTAVTPLVGGDIDRVDEFMRRSTWTPDPLFAETDRRRLALLYGTEQNAVKTLAQAQPSLAEPLGEQCPVSGAEIAFAVQHEMAQRLEDAVLRRTEAGSAGHPGAEALRRAAGVMGALLGWPAARVADEIARVDRRYRIDG